jgi:predicted regulator of Ras-like GTPase activity (Roadblock/LC7/MglB family)
VIIVFKHLLENLLQRVAGSETAMVVGLDGLVVDSFTRHDNGNLEQLAADSSSLIKSGLATTASLSSAALQELTLITGGQRIIMRLLTDSYFVMLLLSDSANLGLARFELRKAQFDLEKELAL